ncbi:MAG: GNAT family N-acetyltransferase [Chitinophagaceae bacterium]
MKFLKASTQHIAQIQHLARLTWQATYEPILEQDQIDFMLNMFYAQPYLEHQILNKTHDFVLLFDVDEKRLLAYSQCIDMEWAYKISKLYVHPDEQGKQYGVALLKKIEEDAKKRNRQKIVLNVNRYNPAQTFYLKHGFQIIEQVDIPLDRFFLNDYVMEKILG